MLWKLEKLELAGHRRAAIGEMIVRRFMRTQWLIFLILSLCSVLLAAQPPQGHSKIVSLDFGVQGGPDGLGRLSISDQPGGILVQVPVKAPADVVKLGLQVWLLRVDGTVVTQSHADREASTIRTGPHVESFVLFSFPKAPVADIIGIAFRKQGKLYCQEIPPDAWKPWN